MSSTDKDSTKDASNVSEDLSSRLTSPGQRSSVLVPNTNFSANSSKPASKVIKIGKADKLRKLFLDNYFFEDHIAPPFLKISTNGFLQRIGK